MQLSIPAAPKRRPRLAVTLLALVVAAVAGLCAIGRSLRPPSDEALGAIGPVPEFRFTDSSGRPVGRAELLGTPWVAAFFFSRCSGLCPTTTMEVARLARETADLPQIRFASITLDPEYDTPEVLAEVARRLGADPSRWLFLTPRDGEEARRFATEGLRLAAGGGDHEEIIHSPRLVLIDAAGTERDSYDVEAPEAMLRLRRDLRRLVAEPG